MATKKSELRLRTSIVRKMTKALKSVQFDGDEESFRTDFWEAWQESLTKDERKFMMSFADTGGNRVKESIIRTLFFRVKIPAETARDIFREFILQDTPWELDEE
jgi:hypothetical protein